MSAEGQAVAAALALPFPQTQPSPPYTLWVAPPTVGCPRLPAQPRGAVTEWALCLDRAISSQQTSEKRTGQGSGQRLRQKHGCL